MYKEKLITKGPYSNPRVISIPTVRDKLTLKVLHDVLVQVYKDVLTRESAQHKIKKVKSAIVTKEYDAFIKMDIKDFYPTVKHDVLLDILKQTIDDENILHLITQAITQNTVSHPRRQSEKNTNKKGLPQGLSISGLLAEIYLLSIDKTYSNSENFSYFRYVDDILILCNEDNANEILKTIEKDMKVLGLNIHKAEKGNEKTSYGRLSEEFTFLGHTFKNGKISVRQASIQKFETSIVKLFTNYKYRRNKKYLYNKLNLRITGGHYKEKQFGWLYFFSHINDLKLLFKLDHFVKKLFLKFDVPYDVKKIKKFSRTYYEIKKNDPSLNYIVDFDKEEFDEEIKYIDLNATQKKSLKHLPKKIRKEIIGNLFDREIKKEFREIKKDIGVYY